MTLICDDCVLQLPFIVEDPSCATCGDATAVRARDVEHMAVRAA